MATMIRKQIYLEKHQDELVKRLAEAKGISEAEVIRDAIDQHVHGKSRSLPPDVAAWEQALEFMLRLYEEGPSGAPSRKWKREDAYEDRLSRYDRRSD